MKRQAMQDERHYSIEFYNVMKTKMPEVLKWGWCVVGFLFILIIASCYFIQYPSMISYTIDLNRDTTVSGHTGVILLPQGEDSLFACGQAIQVKLSKSPYLEYGTIEGRIANIQFNSTIMKSIVTVVFPQELRTSTGQNLSYEEELTGYFEKVTKKDRLIKKIFPSLLKLKKTQRIIEQ